MVAEEDSKPQIFLVERRRKEKRFIVNVPVDVIFDKGEGETVVERTFIEDVSDLGCRFTTRATAQEGDTVRLKILGPNGKAVPNEEPRLYQIMWVARNGRNSTMGARLISGQKLVPLDSPAEGETQDPKSK